jgi:hypothetical protein
MGQPTGIGRVIGILQPVILWYRCRVGQRHPLACLQQPIHEPVPVGGGLDHHAHEGGLRRGEGLQHGGQMLGEASLLAHLLLLME